MELLKNQNVKNSYLLNKLTGESWYNLPQVRNFQMKKH